MPWAIETGTNDASLIAASGTKRTPPGKAPITSAASAMDNLVLPQPPGPVRVSSLLWPRRCRAWASSLSLPTKLVRGRGRRPGASPAPLTAGSAILALPPASALPRAWAARTLAIPMIAPIGARDDRGELPGTGRKFRPRGPTPDSKPAIPCAVGSRAPSTYTSARTMS